MGSVATKAMAGGQAAPQTQWFPCKWRPRHVDTAGRNQHWPGGCEGTAYSRSGQTGAVDQGYVWRASNATWVGSRGLSAGEGEVRPVFREDPRQVHGECREMVVGRVVQVPGTLGRHQALGVEKEGIEGLQVGPVTCVGLYRRSVEE